MFEDLQTLERADKLDCGTASQFRPALTARIALIGRHAASLHQVSSRAAKRVARRVTAIHAGTGIGLTRACPSLALGSFWEDVPRTSSFSQKLVRPRRLELPRAFAHNDLNVARLPVPPRPLNHRAQVRPGGGRSGPLAKRAGGCKRGKGG